MSVTDILSAGPRVPQTSVARPLPRFLLVEDDPYLRDLVCMKARFEKVEMTAVGSVSAALRELEPGRFQLAAIDIMLPDASGVEVARHILGRGLELPFMFISAMNRGAFLEEYATGLGNPPEFERAPYIMKPFSLEYFFVRARHHIEQSRAGRALAAKFSLT